MTVNIVVAHSDPARGASCHPAAGVRVRRGRGRRLRRRRWPPAARSRPTSRCVEQVHRLGRRAACCWTSSRPTRTCFATAVVLVAPQEMSFAQAQDAARARRRGRADRADHGGRRDRPRALRHAHQDAAGGARGAEPAARDAAPRGPAHRPVQPPLRAHATRRADQRRAPSRPAAVGRDDRHRPLQADQRRRTATTPATPRWWRSRARCATGCARRTSSAASAARSSSRCCPTRAPRAEVVAEACARASRSCGAPVAGHELSATVSVGWADLGRRRGAPTGSSNGPM